MLRRKPDKTTVTVKLPQMHEAPAGPRQRPGRAGVHADKRTRRRRTRDAQTKDSVDDQSQ